jgi:hypothetical protein
MLPSTGSGAWDTIAQIAVAVAITVGLVLIIRDYRNRR